MADILHSVELPCRMAVLRSDKELIHHVVSSFFLSFFLSWVSKTQPNHWTKNGEHPISHLGPKNLSQTGGPEHYLVYGRPNQIPNLVGKTDHNVGGLAYQPTG